MTFEHRLLLVSLSLVLTGMVAFGTFRWSRSVTRQSIKERGGKHPGKGGFPTLASLRDDAPRDLDNDRGELRPSWIARLIAPLVALFCMAVFDINPLLRLLGVQTLLGQQVFYALFCLVFASVWLAMLLHQRAVWGQGKLTWHGILFWRQERSLEKLVGVHAPDNSPVVMLRFADQWPLFVPKHLAHIDTFVAEMQRHADHNINNGAVPPMPGL